MAGSHTGSGGCRFLFTCWPIVSHYLPLIGIAGALRDRGHAVAFYTGSDARETIEGQGFTHFPFHHVDTSDDSSWLGIVSQRGDGATRRLSTKQQYQAFRKCVVETIPDQVADLRSVMADWSPDVVVTEPSMWAPAMILWEARPIPVALASQFMGPLLPGPDAALGFGLAPARTAPGRLAARALRGVTDLLAGNLRRRVSELRAQHGLPPLDCPVTTFTGRLPLYLVGSLAELDYSRRDLPPGVHYVGPYLWNAPSPAGTSTWLDAIPTERPWVHVSEGTSHFRDPFVLRSAARGLAGRPVEVLMTTGKDRDPDRLDLGPLGPNVHVTRWLDYGELLARCAVVVTTGGTGTVMAALRAGVPLVVVPTAWDQPDNARRIVESGAGVRLASRRCTPERLRAAVEEVVGDPTYRDTAQRLARRLAAADGPTRAAELLESLAAGRLAVR